MNGNGQVIVAGLFLMTTMVVAMLAVGLFEIPTYTPETRPIELMEIDDREAKLSPAPIEMFQAGIQDSPFSSDPIELLFLYSRDVEHELTPEQIFQGTAPQSQVDVFKIQAHQGACSGLY